MSEKKRVARSITGRVISSKMDKTVTVQIERKVSHPLYQKYVRRSTRISAHDEKNECNEGDLVMIEQCRPLSKNKSWRLIKVLDHAG